TLVSAAAGYGKSTLVCGWLDGLDGRSAWLSLDESDNDLRGFLHYVVAAVQSVFPSAMRETEELLEAASLPPLSFIAGALINDLDELEEPFVLVLDDIHRINERSVNELLAELLTFPPRGFHLMLLGRRDPFLPIAKLRALDQVTEVRVDDLQFGADETASFLKNALRAEVDVGVARAWSEATEGWVTGLRLAALALPDSGLIADDPFKPWKSRRHAMQFLLKEVLERQEPSVLHHLLSSSIADRFCPSLCDVLREPAEERGSDGLDGQEFVARLEEAGLFLIPLDAEHRWFRYHHIFHDLLREEMKRRFSNEAIASLHVRASEWFETEGLIEESLKHAVAADDIDRAAQLVERNGEDLLDSDYWYVLETWLSLLPREAQQQRLGLLLARAWVLYFKSEFEELVALLEDAERLLGDGPEQQAQRGEIDFFRGVICFFQGEGASGQKYLEGALDRIPMSYDVRRGEAEVFHSLAVQMVAGKEQAVKTLDALLNSDPPPTIRRGAALLAAHTYMQLISGDLASARRYAQRFEQAAEQLGPAHLKAWSDCLQGLTDLYRYELDAAVEHLESAADRRFQFDTRAALDSLAALMLAYQAGGQPNKAQVTLQQLQHFAVSLDNPELSTLADSCAARLAISQGQKEHAIHRLEANTSMSPEPMLFWLEIPAVTCCRALIAEGSAASLEEAEARLREYVELNEAHHNTYRLIEILCLLAIACQSQGKADEALVVLERALALAEPGSFIFPFLELGAPLADLLRRLLAEGLGDADFIKRILTTHYERTSLTDAAAPDRAREAARADQPLPDPLTSRELEVLSLLGEGLYQKEIAERLFVSTETVKTHAKHIYQKLGVRDRRAAVENARALDLLDPQ
ncbi:MAG: LuxR C-terminal-related transcriptional regulator, partial [Gemmatimonadales bacterium]